ncbi:MAG: peptidoglycan-binding protein [Solirubrobacteraceae bacterium]
MSGVLWASAAILIGISLTPSVALAANGNHSRSHSEHSSHNITNNDDAAARTAVLAIGAGYAHEHGSAAVRSLQRQLIELGMSPGPVDGRYGPLTADAVRRLQQARGLAVDGIVGPHTRRVLASGMLAAGAGYLQPDGSQRVRSIQRRLAKAGFSPGPIDGRYGPLTTRAVRRFQQAHHQPADGITGPRTQAALGSSRNSPGAAQPKTTTRAHGRNRNRNPRPQARRQPSRAHGNHTPASATPKSTASRHGGHRGVLTALAVIALVALGIALLLAVLLLSRRRRLASASSAREAEVVPEPTGASEPDVVPEPEVAPEPTAVAAAPLFAVPEPTDAREPAPDPADPEHAPDVPESPPVDPARVEQVKALQRQLGVLGFDPGPVDGRYGPRTTDAVKHLQEVSELEPDGIVGPLTAEVLRHNAPEPPADDRVERVKALQRQLSWLGFEPGPADGHYGSLTTGAVKRFQEAHDLPVDGIVDRATADALRANVAQRPSSDRIDRVKALQRQLQWLGLEPGPIDGRYGPQTTEAVRRFQEAHDVPVDGIVGPQTQRALQHSVQRAAQW